MFAVPDGYSEKTELEVFKFTGNGGVALSMYNTDEVQTLKEFSLLFYILAHYQFKCK